MGISSIENYIVDVNKINIPNEGLGEFLVGYTDGRLSFEWKRAWINLLPIIGNIIFLIYVIAIFIKSQRPIRVLIYKNGFIKQKLNSSGIVKHESVYNFNDLRGLLYYKRRTYTTTYGITRYSCTGVTLSVLDTNNVKEQILKGAYKNENEEEGKYNFYGYAGNTITKLWIQFAVKKFNAEIATKGYGTFPTGKKEIQIGRDFIKVDEIVVKKGKFSYLFDNGYLYLYPEGEKKSKRIGINIAEMYNKEAFLIVAQQLHGIR